MADHASPLLRRLGAASVMLCAPVLAGAQGRVPSTGLVGIVRDSVGRPVTSAELRIAESALLARTNDSGGFRFSAVPVGRTTVVLRRLGYAQETIPVTLREGRIDSLVITLSALAAELPGVLVVDEAEARSRKLLAGFWERRSRGFGYFVTRGEIEKKMTSDFTDLVRQVPSVMISTVNGRKVIGFFRNGGSPSCPPQYFVDGMRIQQGSPDEFTPEDIEAIEVYAGAATTPPQFAPYFYSRTCGAIVIWTRLPGQ